MTHSPTHSELLADDIRRAAGRSATPFIIAIDGRSGVGKSILARALASELNAGLIEGDDFYAGGVTVRSEPPEILAAICMDWRRLGQTLAALVQTGTTTYFPFDWARFDGRLAATPKTLTAKPFIILEGVYTARPELRPQIDMCVLAVAKRSVRLARLKQREGPMTEWERQWHRAEDHYFAEIAPADGFEKIIHL